MDAYQKRWDDASRAIAQLHATPQDTAQEKKAAAAHEIERIKERISMLMRMGNVGNPKANLREIAQLAKELASVAHEYAAASGGGAATLAATGVNGGAAAIPAQMATGMAASTPGVSDQPSVNATAASASIESVRQYQENQKQQLNGEVQGKIAGLQEKSASSDADNKFIAEVRNLVSQLKALGKQQEKRAQQAGGESGESEVAKMNQAISEAMKSVEAISAAGVNMPSPVNLFA